MGGLPTVAAAQAIAEAAGCLRLPLYGGRHALISHEDADLLALKWVVSKYGALWYVKRKLGRGRQSRAMKFLHREVMERAGFDITGLVIDHINGDGLDNRRCNLRAVSQAVNTHNYSGLRPNNTSGVSGVSYDRHRGKWAAFIRCGGRKINLGRHPTLADAAAARLAGERRLWGIEPRRAELHRCA